MLNKEYKGMITSVSAGVKTEKTEEGEPFKRGVVNFKLECNSFDYSDIQEHFPQANQVLNSIQPIPFKSITFDKPFGNIKMLFNAEDNENLFGKIQEDTELKRITICEITIKINQNIPNFILKMSFPLGYGSEKTIMNSLKQIIRFQLNQE